jgi:murein L,D-transpeptidase YafK
MSVLRYSLFLFLLSCQWPVQAGLPMQGGRWIWINTATHTLEVIEKGEIKHRFRNIAIGRNGYAKRRRQGDGTTPLGTFHIAWVNPDSRFNIFLGLDYPNRQLAEMAWRSDVIDFDTYYTIRRALAKGRIPPQDTVLGGYIGIHGTGHTSERFHRLVNWTQGCVALTNKQIEQLLRWVRIGMKVVISNGAIADHGGATKRVIDGH